MHAIAGILTGRRSGPALLIAILVLLGVGLAFLPRPVLSDGTAASGDSELVAKWQSETPAANGETAILVWTRDGGGALSSDQRTAVESAVVALRAQSIAPKSVWAQLSVNRTAILAVVPVSASGVQRDPEAVANHLMATARGGVPAGVRVRLTGDVASAVTAQQSSDTALLSWLIVLAALVLILATRSALGWIIPVVVIAPAAIVGQLLGVDAAAGLGLTFYNAEVALAVTFGVGIAWTCALVYRYRAERSDAPHSRQAAWLALVSTTPALIAGTAVVVAVGLVMLLASDAPTRALGLAIVVGVLVVALALFIAMPAALSLFGRAGLWPFARSDRRDPTVTSAIAGSRRPIVGAFVGLVVLGLLGIGTVAATFSPNAPAAGAQSAQARASIDRAFPKGYGNQAIMLVPNELAGSTSIYAPTTLAMIYSEVHSVTRGPSNRGQTELVVDLQADPGSAKAVTTIQKLRERIARTGGPTAKTLVGGPDATIADAQTAAVGDLGIVVPIALVIVLLLLILMTRQVAMPVAVVVAEAAAFVGALGVTALVLHQLDPISVIVSLVISVALGAGLTAVQGLDRQGVGSDALLQGLVIAAAFGLAAVLATSDQARDVGMIVAVSALLDAVLVRTLMLPSIATATRRTA